MATEEGREWIADLAELKADTLAAQVNEQVAVLNRKFRDHVPGHLTPSPTREVTRLITYRGTSDEVAAQLGKSLPDGIREVRRGTMKLTVRTLDDTASLLMGTPDPAAGLLVRLGAVECELSAARLAQRDAENELQVLRAQLAAPRQEAKDARANLAQWQSARPT